MFEENIPKTLLPRNWTIAVYSHARRFRMTSEQKKRSRPIPNKSQRSKKRQKIEPVKDAVLEKRKVAVDALPWHEVEMPDMFDDAEGFFGLEEVEGVEVIRDGDTIQFVCLPPFSTIFLALQFLGIFCLSQDFGSTCNLR